MVEFEERKKFWRIFYSPLVLAVLFIVFVFLVRAMWRVGNYENTSAIERERVEKELDIVNKRSQVLKDQFENLQTTRGVEDEIRSKFNVTKQGEAVAVVVEVQSTTTATATAQKESWWGKFINFLRD